MLAAIGWSLAATMAIAQPTAAGSDQEVMKADRDFWAAYNACDVDAMGRYFTDDLEFYHDKGGLISGKKALIASSRDGLCKPGGSRIRREVVEGSVHFYPLAGYGGILSGEHVFFVHQSGKSEYLDGQARFTHVWRLAEGNWRMSRVLSYDHGPPHSKADKTVTLSPSSLARYAGKYRSRQQGEVATITVRDARLQLAIGNITLVLEPVSETRFVVTERNLRFDFVPAEAGSAYVISIWENGTLVDEAKPIS